MDKNGAEARWTISVIRVIGGQQSRQSEAKLLVDISGLQSGRGRAKLDLQLDDLRDIPDPDRGSPGSGTAGDINLSSSYPLITITDSVD